MRYRRPSSLVEYSYPEHLRDCLSKAPSAAGVYIFRSASNDFPLYIGKSVNIRSRLLSHFRDTAKGGLLRSAASIDWIRTAGDLGASLLEAKLIKTLQPLHNKRLRRLRRLFSLELTGTGLTIMPLSGDTEGDGGRRLFGLFSSRHAAIESLRDLADREGLCYQYLGIEPASSHACFRYGLGRCRGACIGLESVERHAARLEEALADVEVRIWPWPGRMAIVDKAEDMQEFHIVDRWQYLGTVPTPAMGSELPGPEQGFDRDGYRLLLRPMLSGEYAILPVAGPR